jgi:hypothetical protein
VLLIANGWPEFVVVALPAGGALDVNTQPGDKSGWSRSENLVIAQWSSLRCRARKQERVCQRRKRRFAYRPFGSQAPACPPPHAYHGIPDKLIAGRVFGQAVTTQGEVIGNSITLGAGDRLGSGAAPQASV